MALIESWIPWVGTAVGVSLLGAFWSHRASSAPVKRRRALLAAGAAFVACSMAWIVSATGGAAGPLALDPVGTPMLPLSALITFVTVLGTLRPKSGRLSFPRALVQAALHFLLFSCTGGWVLIALLAATAIPPAFDLRARGSSLRLYSLYQATAVVAMALGWALANAPGDGAVQGAAASLLLVLGVAIRCGLFPGHAWVTDLYEAGPFGGSLLATVPFGGVLAVVRLLPGHIAPWASGLMTALAVFTAFYAAGMTLVQRSARRFFSFLLLSHGALVVAGLSLGTPLGVTGALCMWISIALAMTGLGLTLRSLEARTGRLTLTGFHGMHAQTPALAAFFLLTGLAAVGFPGTIGFFGADLLVEGGQEAFGFGPAVVACGALNGISVLRAYAILFLGPPHMGTVDLRCRRSERLAILSLTLLLVGGVLYPGPAIRSRHAAAKTLSAPCTRQLDPDAK